MERPIDAMRMMPRAATAVAFTLALAAAGCGEDDDFANQPRPPSPIVVSAAVTESGVSVSPDEFGAGAVNLIVTNQTDGSHEVTLASRGGGESLQQGTGPINPGDTASVKVDLEPGTYRVSAGSGSIEPATVEVGPPRESAQDRLLEP